MQRRALYFRITGSEDVMVYYKELHNIIVDTSNWLTEYYGNLEQHNLKNTFLADNFYLEFFLIKLEQCLSLQIYIISIYSSSKLYRDINSGLCAKKKINYILSIDIEI